EFTTPAGAQQGSTSPSFRYLFGPGQDEVLAQESGGIVLWLLGDAEGSIRDLVTNSGAVANHITYGAFGTTEAQSNSAAATRYMYTAREFDSAAGLYYYRARYYDPAMGRFLSQDPTGLD